MSNLIKIPFVGGIREDIESKIAPYGVLSSVKNLKLEKDTKWAKRPRYDGITLSDWETNSTIKTANIISLGERVNDQVITIGNPCEMFVRNPDKQRLVNGDGEYFALPNFSAPEKTTVVASLDESVIVSDSVTTNGYTVVAYERDTGIGGIFDGIWVKVYNSNSGVFLYEQSVYQGDSAQKPQLVAVGNYVVLFFLTDESGTYKLRRSVLNTGGSGIQQFATSSVISAVISTTYGLKAGISATNLGSTAAFVTAQISSTTVTAFKLTAPTFTSTSLNFTDADGYDGYMYSTCYASESEDTFWIGWYSDYNDRIIAATVNATLFSSAGTQTIINTDDNNNKRPSITVYDTGKAAIAWSGYGLSTEGGYIRYCTLTSANPPVAGSIKNKYGVTLGSNLFSGPVGENYQDDASLSAVYAIGIPDSFSGVGASSSRNYFGLYLDFGNGDSGSYVQAQFGDQLAPPHASLLSLQQLGHVQRTTDGYYRWAGAIVNRGLANDSTAGIGVNLYKWDDFSYNRCQPVKFGQNLYFTGGIVSKFDGQQPREAGILRAPDIIAATEGTSGSLTPSAIYQYIAVYERIDSDNSNRIRSAPSAIGSITLSGTGTSVALVIRDNKIRQEIGPFAISRVHIYRTVANGSNFFRITPNVGLPLGGYLNFAGNISYTDTTADADIEDEEVVYTQVGGTLAFYPPPPCKYMFVAGQRLWCCGLEDPEIAECSNEYFHGEEPAQFTRNPAFRVHAPGKILGGGSLESVPVLFTKNHIVQVLGQGPTSDGGSGIFEVHTIPSDGGLVEWGQRSIVETKLGLFFQSQPNRIDLLPRGFGPPVWIGEPVKDTLESYPYITSAVLIEDEKEVRFTCVDNLFAPTDGVMLCYDLRKEMWSIADDGYYSSATTWGGAHILGKLSTDLTSAISIETSNSFKTGVSYVSSQITTHDISPSGPGDQYGRARVLNVVLEFISGCYFTMELSVDGGQSWISSGYYQLSLDDYSVGDVINLRWHLPVQKSDRYRFRFTDSVYQDQEYSNTGAVKYIGFSFEMRPKSGAKRVGSGKRR